jgi:hypothetical protein
MLKFKDLAITVNDGLRIIMLNRPKKFNAVTIDVSILFYIIYFLVLTQNKKYVFTDGPISQCRDDNSLIFLS